MRKPQQKKVKRSPEFPQGIAYYGAVRHRGKQLWVPGTYGKVSEWQDAAREKMAEADQQADAPAPTVSSFTNWVVADDGKVVPLDEDAKTWPRTHERGGLKASSVRRYEEALRPFVRAFGDRPLTEVTALEAREWADDQGAHAVDACRRLFADAARDEVVSGRNPFEGLTNKKVPRVRQPDYEMISDEEYENILGACLTAEEDDYGYVVRAMAILMGTMGMRPGEMYALEWQHLDFDNELIAVRQSVDDRGVVQTTKNSLRRMIPMTAGMADALKTVPKLSDRFVFPAPRGGVFTNANFSSHWKAIKAGAGITRDVRWYDLKHRALTRMVTPKPDGAGVDVQTAAVIAGHQDGGITLATHYLRMDERLAVARVAEAFKDTTSRHLKAV